MDRAGLAVALAATRLGARYGSRVAVLAGPGGNGGDGYVAARYLRKRGCAVSVHALGSPARDSAAGHAVNSAAAYGVPVEPLGQLSSRCDLVVDALFGGGFHGSLPDVVMPWLRSEAPVIAVDAPSGLDAATGHVRAVAFHAVRTVTFHALKPGHLLGEGPEHCGEIEVVDIGLEGGDVELMVCEDGDAPRPTRLRTAHKWTAGSVLVVGGSPGISGAAVLAARSALEMGAGSVAVACPGGIAPMVAAAGPGLMTRPIGDDEQFQPDDAASIADEAARFDVVVLGPGLGSNQAPLVASLLDALAGPVVLDADGINSLDGIDSLAGRAGPTVLTPHAGEFERLTGSAAHYRSAAEVADRAGVVVVLKGNPTFVLGRRRWVVTSGGPELATIGTGDVLAGMIAALWARGLDAEVAARSGAHWHGRAGAALSLTGTVTAERLSAAVGGFAW